MNLTNRNVAFIALMLLFIILLPAITGLVGLIPDDELPDDNDDLSVISNLTVAWGRIAANQLPSGLMLGISIFALFVVYLGGRTNHKRFNDRTIDSVKLSPFVFPRTALLLLRAVFVFLLPVPYPVYEQNNLTNCLLLRTMMPDIRRFKP